MRWMASALTVVAFAACSDAPVFEVPRYSSVQPIDVVLAPGERVVVDDTFTISFRDVSEDSRCATDVTCVWAGNGAVVLELTSGSSPAHSLTLNTGVVPHTGEYAGYRIQLDGLTPEPVSTSTIPRSAYRASLHIEAVR